MHSVISIPQLGYFGSSGPLGSLTKVSGTSPLVHLGMHATFQYAKKAPDLSDARAAEFALAKPLTQYSIAHLNRSVYTRKHSQFGMTIIFHQKPVKTVSSASPADQNIWYLTSAISAFQG